jgi:thiamine biosynthesis lipoprotein
MMPEAKALAAAHHVTGTRWLEWDAAARSVRFARDGVEIDFNGIGKGFAMDEAASLARSAGLGDFLLHGGQSSVVAAGHERRGGPNEVEPGWRIGIADPLVPRRRLAEVRLVDEALATSGSARQSFIHDGQRYGHVLDPRTGWPARHWLSTTVIHVSATVCDVLSTATMVMSETEIDALAASRPEVVIVAVRTDAAAQGLETRTWNVRDDRFQRCPAG